MTRERLAWAAGLLSAGALVTAVVVVVVGGLGAVPRGAESDVIVVAIVAACISALVAPSVHRRVRAVVDRRLHVAGGVVDAAEVFSHRVSRDVPLDEVLLQTAETLRRTMPLTSAEIWAGTDGRYEVRASVPDRRARPVSLSEPAQGAAARAGVSGATWASIWAPELLDGPARAGGDVRLAPVTYGGILQGFVVVTAQDGIELGPEHVAALHELVRRMGPVLHNAQLDVALQDSLEDVRRHASELRHSRARLVAAADAERRRIERDLHDGAQQHLVALSVSLKLARQMVTTDPAAAAEMLDELGDQVKATVRELRDLAHGIYPPILVDSGLGPALRAAADRSPLDVTVDDVDAGRAPPDVEAAVYFCCLEALQNAAKHATGASVEVRLRQESGGLLFEVSDDGPGFDVEAAGGGHGFVNMADRVGAIGGRVTVDSSPGHGTRIAGTVPLRS